MSELLNDCMSGLLLLDPRNDNSIALDFVLTGALNTDSMVLPIDWWNADDVVAAGFITYPSAPLRNANGIGWTLQTSILSPPEEDDAGRLKLVNNRDKADFERPAYLIALLQMRDQFPGTNIDEWIAAIQTRPIRDPLQEVYKAMSVPRQMAKVYMQGAGGKTVDVLVIDDRGGAAQGGDDPWMAKIADEYRNKDVLPPLADYVNWVADQTPYGGNALIGPAVFTSGGLIHDVASTLLASRAQSLT